MAFLQPQHRPQSSRQLSVQPLACPAIEAAAVSKPQRKPSLENSEWILFSPSTAAPTTTSTDHTVGLSRVSDFGSLDTGARSDQEDDDITEDLDSLDDLNAFHEPSEYATSASRLPESSNTVLPTHDGLGLFQPNAAVEDHMWQFERQPRRRPARRRSSVQRRLNELVEADQMTTENDRRQRIEQWRLEQSKALLDEIEKETRRRRRMSMMSTARSRADNDQSIPAAQTSQSVLDGQRVSSDETDENLWQRLRRKVIDLIGIDEGILSVIFGESLPDEAISLAPPHNQHTTSSSKTALRTTNTPNLTGTHWEYRLLERIARELGILVHQTENPGAFSLYRTRDMPGYMGPSSTSNASASTTVTRSEVTARSTRFAPERVHIDSTDVVQQSSNTYSEASLWGIEEDGEDVVDHIDSFRDSSAPIVSAAEETALEQEYWERELDVNMVFRFLLRRFSSQDRTRSTPSYQRRDSVTDASAHRAKIIRQNHPLVGRRTDRPTSSSNTRETRRKDTVIRQHFTPQSPLRNHGLKSSSSCASQSTKKSKRSAGNYWDLGGSVGSGSVITSEV
jgi:hypothetical protein